MVAATHHGYASAISLLVARRTPAYRRAWGRAPSIRAARIFGCDRAMATAVNDVGGRSEVRTGANDSAPLILESDYRPSADEAFMGPRQQAYFRAKLLSWKDSILRESQGTLNQLQVDSLREPDVTDRASAETDWSIELRTRDRQRKLISKIDAALRRIDEGEYGYCEVTGEPISLARLEARPVATMTVEAQEKHERQEKISRDD